MYESGFVDPFSDNPEPELASVRPGEDLDWVAIESYIRSNLSSEIELNGELEVQQFPNGAANLTYLVNFGDTELVLRRPPFGALAPGSHDMKREFKVLSNLWEHFDPAPRAFVLCEDSSVAGADFFVMERRCGAVIRGVIPTEMRHHQRVGHRIGVALAEAVGRFHLLDPAVCGLSDLGRPHGFVERQVRGWKQRWDLVADTTIDAQMIDVHKKLEATRPEPQRESFVHNDLKLDNCMIDPSNPDRVVAIFDWDMTTLGDPLVDVGTLLNYWPDPGDPDEVARATHDGMALMGLPTRSEVVEHYAVNTGLDLGGIRWYEAFAQWKTATVCQQLHHRWKLGESSDPRMETIADMVPVLAQTAQDLLQ